MSDRDLGALDLECLWRPQPLLEHPNVGDVRGKGSLIGIELVADRETREPMLAAIAQRCADHGVIVGRTTSATPRLSNVLILAPPLILTTEEAGLIVPAVEDALMKLLPADAANR